jgi:L-fuculose-phosphate aldolase
VRRGLRERLAARRRDGELIATARGLERHDLVVGTVGNVSVRDGAHLRVTPTQSDYGRMRPRDLVTVALADGGWDGPARPSRELSLHVAIYRARPDVRAIVHAHGTYAAAWSFLGVPLSPPIEESSYYGIGPVRVSDPAPAGSTELGAAGARALGGSAAALLGGHGLVAVGADLGQALLAARVVEHHAHVAWLLRTGGADGRASAEAAGRAGSGAGDRAAASTGSARHAARGRAPGTRADEVTRTSTVSDILG